MKILLIFVLVLGAEALRRRKFIDPVIKQHRAFTSRQTSEPDPTYSWDERWFNETLLDHFTYGDSRTFAMRYFINTTYYQAGGPIFFYCGNEGALEGFTLATGIMWDMAKDFKAALLFAEHRFYGKTLPFGNDSYSSAKNLAYLSSVQALGDYAQFLTTIRLPGNPYNTNGFTPDTKVVSFGGSYGGMLAAWFRIKYPHITIGSWASSAPLIYFKDGGVDLGAFDKVSTQTFTNAGANFNLVVKGWQAIRNLANTTDGQNYLNTLFNIEQKSLIKSPTGGDYLIDFIIEGLEYMAMVDYPYPSDFLTPMPGYPATAAAQFLKGSENQSDQDVVKALYLATNVYYNGTGNTSSFCIDPNVCGDQATAALGSPYGWPWQECSEIIIEMCTRGPPSDFYIAGCPDNDSDIIKWQLDYCKDTFTPFGYDPSVLRERAIQLEYGLSFAGASNIILTNGALDPWSAGGVTSTTPGVSLARGIYTALIDGSAHHLDLRQPNTCDPNTVRNARFQIYNIIQCWLTNTYCNIQWIQLPGLQIPNVDVCKPDLFGYPWGQAPDPSAPTGTAGTGTPPTTTSASLTTIIASMLMVLAAKLVL